MTRRVFLATALLALLPKIAHAAPSATTPHGDPGCLPRASDGVPEPSADEKRRAAMAVMPRMYGQEIAQQANAAPSSLRVTPDLGTLAIDNIMGGLWARCGLTGRERSLVTLTIVMASRANSQIAEHIRVGMRNGLTQREIEEVIYQVGGYAGVPQAANAREVLIKVLDERRQKSEGR